MYIYSPMDKIVLQAFIDGGCQLARNVQHKMNKLFQGFEFICLYVYKLFVLKKSDRKYHVQKL